MRGAVLYGLGSDFVKERILRRSYGLRSSPVFIEGKHPQSRKFTGVDGLPYCKDVMDWIAIKVRLDYRPR